MTIQPVGTAGSAWGVDHPRPPRGGPDMSGLARRLGVTTDDLRTARDAGQSLAELATSKGISRDDAIAAVKADMSAHRPDGAPALPDDQLTTMATGMVDRKPGADGPGRAGGAALPDASVLGALRGLQTSDGASLADVLAKVQATGADGSTGDGLKQLLALLRRGGYGQDGATTTAAASLGLDATA